MSLLDPKWKYTHSTATDIRKTFAKARRDLAKRDRTAPSTPKLQLIPPSAVSAESSGHGSRSVIEAIGARKREAR
jgi:hypothetical protein